MDAGKIEIKISANYSALEGALKDSVSTSQQSGQEAGAAYGQNFEAGQVKYIDRAIQDMQGKLKKAFGAVALGQALAGTLEAAANGASFGDAIVSSIKATPLVGIVATIVESGMKLAFGVFDAEEKARSAKTRNEDAHQRLKAAEERQMRVRDMERTASDVSFKLLIQQERAAGNEKRAQELELNQEISHIQRDRVDRLAAAKSQEEKDVVERTFNLEMTAAKDRVKFAQEKAEKAAQEVYDKNLKDDQERAKKYGEALMKEEKKASEERFKKDLDDVKKLHDRLVKADEMRAEAAQQADSDRLAFAKMTGSMSTSFGSFTFKGYSDSDKQQVDQSILAQVREINKKATDFVNTGIQ